MKQFRTGGLKFPTWQKLLIKIENGFSLRDLYKQYKEISYCSVWEFSKHFENQGIITTERVGVRNIITLTPHGTEIRNNIIRIHQSIK